MFTIDINSDIGEGFGIYTISRDDDIVRLITSANIACGFHAGDPEQMFKTTEMCLKNGVAIGAHPGYPDLAGFGRRAIEMSRRNIRNMILYQVGALMAIAGALGGRVEHVKPHGALYNTAFHNAETALAVIEAVGLLNGPALVAPAGSVLAKKAPEKGVRVIIEGFADRRYNPDGTLADRQLPGAVITSPDQAAKQALQMVTQRTVSCLAGEELNINIDTICIHGDNLHAVDILKAIRNILIDNKVDIAKHSKREHC